MKPQDKKNIISAIQNNLKQMQHEAQRYLDKHHTNLPPICSARHYLFHSLNISSDAKLTNIKIGRDKGDKDTGDKSKGEQKKQEQKGLKFNPKTSIYNLQFRNKAKSDQARGSRIPSLNLTLMRSRMNGSWRANRYLDNISSRTSLESSTHNQKLKTIVLNSEALELSDKDLRVSPNMFSPKLSKLNLPKKQSDVLQKYLTRFKQEYKSTELQRPQSIKLDQLNEISTKQLQKVISKQPENEHCTKRSRIRACRQINQTKTTTAQPSESNDKSVSRRVERKSFKTLDIRIKSRIEEQLLKLPKHKSSLQKQKKQVNLDAVQIDCAPWAHEDKFQQSNNYDFS